jgi:hypothetical protein
MNWQSHFELWQEALAQRKLAKANQLISEACKSLPRTKENEKWQWFVEALQDQLTCGFVACVFSKHPIPKVLMEPFLNAGIKFGNASTIKAFVIPCLETFGVSVVDGWFASKDTHDTQLQEKIEMARYWYPAAKRSRR